MHVSVLYFILHFLLCACCLERTEEISLWMTIMTINLQRETSVFSIFLIKKQKQTSFHFFVAKSRFLLKYEIKKIGMSTLSSFGLKCCCRGQQVLIASFSCFMASFTNYHFFSCPQLLSNHQPHLFTWSPFFFYLPIVSLSPQDK